MHSLRSCSGADHYRDLVHPLDHPVWTSLTGGHAHLALRQGNAARYGSGISGFAAVDDVDCPEHFFDLAALVAPGETVAIVTLDRDLEATPGFTVQFRGVGHQLLATEVVGEASTRARVLTVADVPAMVDLVGRTKPGPFTERTIELGHYVGIFDDNQLVAMAGQRFTTDVGHEISAVCTDPEFRSKGLARELISHLVGVDAAAGRTSFLHVAETNTGAHALYTSMGFLERRRVCFVGLVRTPD